MNSDVATYQMFGHVPHASNQLNDNSDAEPIPWTENYDAVIAKKFGDNDKCVAALRRGPTQCFSSRCDLDPHL